MNEDLINSIKTMTVNGNRLELPKDEKFDNYLQVKKCLLAAGGKYKKCGFYFSEDAALVKSRLVGGGAINDKKKFQFFATPSGVVDLLMNHACIDSDMLVLEPSAGQGAIVDAIIGLGAHASMIELMPQNIKVLNRKYEIELAPLDFLNINPEKHIKYKRIVANPPFTKNQDVDHVSHMYKFLNEGGLLVSIMSTSWVHGSQKKQIAFREWLGSVDSYTEEIPQGSFKESGTNISTMLVVINKAS